MMAPSDYEIDHTISEGIRPAADKKRKLTPADGRLQAKKKPKPELRIALGRPGLARRVPIVLNVISLGAGVQSTTMALMAAQGELTPVPDCAIFADTQSEPAGVYRHLDRLERQLPFPIHRVTAGSLKKLVLAGGRGEARIDGRPPFFTAPSGGMLNRTCTKHFKILPIMRKARELLGIEKGKRAPKTPVIEMWIGISLDEALRMKPSPRPFIENRWPLLEKRMRRGECMHWLTDHGFQIPQKSACTFCPFTDDARWREMKLNDPMSFDEACEIDGAIRSVPGTRGRSGQTWFVHRSGRPLAEVDFSSLEDLGQLDLFNNECEGMCGV